MSKDQDPRALGADAIINLVMPVIRKASNELDGEDLVRVYGGAMGALYGSMLADFGPTMGPKILQMYTRKLLEMTPMEQAQ